MKHQFKPAEWGGIFMSAYGDGMHNGPRCTACGTEFCVHCDPERVDEQCPAAPQPEPMFDVKYYAAHIPVSNELLMDYGLLPDTRPPTVYTRRQHLRWAAQARVRRIRLRLGSWVAGEDLDPDRYDD